MCHWENSDVIAIMWYWMKSCIFISIRNKNHRYGNYLFTKKSVTIKRYTDKKARLYNEDIREQSIFNHLVKRCPHFHETKYNKN